MLSSSPAISPAAILQNVPTEGWTENQGQAPAAVTHTIPTPLDSSWLGRVTQTRVEG